jgi:hypothetical protein
MAGRENQADQINFPQSEEFRQKMYCANCGSQIKAELNYCSRCGARVSKPGGAGGAESTQKNVADNLSSAISYVGGFGLLGFIFMALTLVKKGVPINGLVVLSMLYLGTLFGICYLMLRQINAYSKNDSAKNSGFSNDYQTVQLNPAITAQLEERQPQPTQISVTENTTKTLDEVLLKRN